MKSIAIIPLVCFSLVLAGCLDVEPEDAAPVDDSAAPVATERVLRPIRPLPQPGQVYSFCGYSLCMDGWVDSIHGDPSCPTGIRTYCTPCGGGYPQPQCR